MISGEPRHTGHGLRIAAPSQAVEIGVSATPFGAELVDQADGFLKTPPRPR